MPENPKTRRTRAKRLLYGGAIMLAASAVMPAALGTAARLAVMVLWTGAVVSVAPRVKRSD